MLDALFPPLPNTHHAQQFSPVRDRSGFLRQVIAPVVVIGERFDEEHRPVMAVSVSLKATRLGVREASALQAFERLNALDVLAKGTTGKERMGEVDALRFRFIRLFLHPQVNDVR